MGSSKFTGRAPSAFRLVNATQQRRALRFIADVLTGPSLYLNATDYELLSQRAYTYGGMRWSDDSSSLGRLPAPLLQDARGAKRSILRSLFLPLRVDAMARSAWAARGGLGGTCAFVSDAEARRGRVVSCCPPHPVPNDRPQRAPCPIAVPNLTYHHCILCAADVHGHPVVLRLRRAHCR